MRQFLKENQMLLSATILAIAAIVCAVLYYEKDRYASTARTATDNPWIFDTHTGRTYPFGTKSR